MLASETIRVRVKPISNGRLRGWSVRCGGCTSEIFLPQRNKTLAIEVATAHSEAVHAGQAILAVKK